MKKGKVIGVIAVVACILTGCIDEMPDMTQEQTDLIAEYAAGMLLKYSSNYEYRLADMEEIKEQEQLEEKEQEAQAKTEEAMPENTEPLQSGVEILEEPEEVDLAELLELDSFQITYRYMELSDSYPTSQEKGTGFSVSAPQGKKLLVLHFDVENKGAAAENCNIFDKQVKILANVNGTGYQEIMNTLLVNDFATFIEDIPAKEAADAVIVVTVGDISEKEIETVNLQVYYQEGVTSIRVK